MMPSRSTRWPLKMALAFVQAEREAVAVFGEAAALAHRHALQRSCTSRVSGSCMVQQAAEAAGRELLVAQVPLGLGARVRVQVVGLQAQLRGAPGWGEAAGRQPSGPAV